MLKIDRSFARNIDFKVVNSEAHKKARRKTSILKLVPKLEEVVRNALMLQHVSSRVAGFPVASPCLWGKLQNLSFSKVSKQVVVSFCVAGVALPDIITCLQTCRKSFCVVGAILLRSFASFSEDELHFSWQAQHFGDLRRHLRGRRSTSDVLCVARSTL